MKKYYFLLLIPVLAVLGILWLRKSEKHHNWVVYGGNSEAMRYSSLTQINKENVKKLKIAWVFSANEPDSSNRSQIQCNPIIVNGILYGVSPKKKIFALDAFSGKELWKFNPFDFASRQHKDEFWGGVIRGMSYWKEGKDERILVSSGAYLFCLDAKNGKPVESFGENGRIDLRNDLDRDVTNLFVVSTSPGIVYKNLIIVGTRVSENIDAAPGHIRAYHIKTGKRAWIFHTIPHPGEFGYETWEDKDAYKKIGGANCWAGMSLDETRGIVYVPTGSASFDFYGGYRKGDNLFANCILALDAKTGKRIWHFQTIHHDLWDRDLPANPNLVTITKDGKKIDCVAQITKTGLVFLLNRTTGKPIFPIREVPVPSSDLSGEKTAATQPFPTLPKPFARQIFTEKDINPYSEQKDSLLKVLKNTKTGNMFIPPGKQGSIIFPGFDGGGEWGGAAFDPSTEILYVNANEMPWILKIVDVDTKTQNKETMFFAGKRLYGGQCGSCHGANMEGDAQGVFPALTQVKSKFSKTQVSELLLKGKGMMPAFKHLPEQDREAILAYLMNMDSLAQQKEYVPATENKIKITLPYTTTGYNRFVDKKGYPAIKPPWGTLNAIDLKTGEILWKIPLGEFAKLRKKGIPITGTENYGGPTVTAGGLIFIAATKDEKFRAFDKNSGKLLWETQLPAGGYATPAVYEVKGKQFVVIACGGGKMGTKSGDKYLAFALPD